MLINFKVNFGSTNKMHYFMLTMQDQYVDSLIQCLHARGHALLQPLNASNYALARDSQRGATVLEGVGQNLSVVAQFN